MTFNEENTIENALRDHLCRKVANGGGWVTDTKGGAVQPFESESLSYQTAGDCGWKLIHGDDLVLHGKQPQDVFVEPWLKESLCRLNPIIGQHPDLADEVIHRLRGVLLDASYSGLIRANEIFHEWLLGKNSMPLGKDGEHITINLIDFDHPENNRYVLSQQVPFTGTRDAYFDLVFFVNGIPLVVGEVKTPVRDAISWQICSALHQREKPSATGRSARPIKTGLRGIIRRMAMMCRRICAR